MIKRFLLRLLFATGLLGLYHRLRNRNALTVIALHRVLAEDDPRWRSCDPLYTVSVRFFEQCMGFLKAHYSIVSLDDVMRARRTGERLPPRPCLVTFDDGWADNHRYALPILRQLGIPAALFVAADAIDRREAFFQERIIASWRTGSLNPRDFAVLWVRAFEQRTAPEQPLTEAHVRALIARLQEIPFERRRRILADVLHRLIDDQREMITSAELREMCASGFAVGTHGKMHEALTAVTDVDSELRDSKAIVARVLSIEPDGIRCLSFPFSKQDAGVVERARAAGYELLFGGGLTMTPLKRAFPDLIARIGITAGEVSDARGELREHALAAYLFRRPHRPLVPG
jgi:peptidoglycan/xylan/chitin deacetylase (PgdA/CDA1 family)